MKVLLALLLIILPIIGLADAGYITYEEFSGGEVQCGSGFDCGAVLNSPYAHIGPLPLAALGLMFYSTFLILGILHFLELDLTKVPLLAKITWPKLFLLLGSAGFLFSLYLVFLMGVVIEAWCKFCLISAGTSTLLFIVSVINYLSHQKKVEAPTLQK